MFAMIGLAYALSYDRRRFPWQVVFWGTALQLLFAFFILGKKAGKIAFQWPGDKVTTFLSFTRYGTEFLFGNLVKPEYQNTFGLQLVFAAPPTKVAGDVIAAAAIGAADGMKLAVNVGAMLLAFIALIAVLNAGMGIIHNALAGLGFPYFPSELRVLFGWIFAPLA